MQKQEEQVDLKTANAIIRSLQKAESELKVKVAFSNYNCCICVEFKDQQTEEFNGYGICRDTAVTAAINKMFYESNLIQNFCNDTLYCK